MIFEHELQNLNEDEQSLLWYIITKNGEVPELWDYVLSTRKESVLKYIMKNKSKFNEKGTTICKELMKKLINVENC